MKEARIERCGNGVKENRQEKMGELRAKRRG